MNDLITQAFLSELDKIAAKPLASTYPSRVDPAKIIGNRRSGKALGLSKAPGLISTPTSRRQEKYEDARVQTRRRLLKREWSKP